MRHPLLGVWVLVWGLLLWVVLAYLLDLRLVTGTGFSTQVPDLTAFIAKPAAVHATATDNSGNIAEIDPSTLELIETGGSPDSADTPVEPVVRQASRVYADSLYPLADTARPVDTSQQRVLLIGDSMAENLYFSFYDLCKWSNYHFKVVALRGTASPFWAQNDTLKGAIEAFRPTLILFTLGANELLIPKLKTRARYYKAILNQMDSIPYVWVGTPVWTGDTVYRNMMRALVPKGQFFDSQGMELPRQADGAHPTLKASKVWADSIARWMVYRGRYPVYFHLKRPKGYIQKVKNPLPRFQPGSKKNSLPKKKQPSPAKKDSTAGISSAVKPTSFSTTPDPSPTP